MRLFSKHFGGAGRPIVILHGFFGSHKNWSSAAAAWTDIGAVYGLDARNHGESPHAAAHTLEDLTGDLAEWLAEQGFGREGPTAPVLVGHSMGGLTVMNALLRRRVFASGAVIVDIAPRPYHTDHRREIAALSLDFSTLKSRADIDAAMSAYVPETALRRFLQMNLKRESAGFRCKINTPVLGASTYAAQFEYPGTPYPGPILFAAGGASDFVVGEDFERIREYFPNARVEVKADGDHWLHYSGADWFIPLTRDFIVGLS